MTRHYLKTTRWPVEFALRRSSVRCWTICFTIMCGHSVAQPRPGQWCTSLCLWGEWRRPCRCTMMTCLEATWESGRHGLQSLGSTGGHEWQDKSTCMWVVAAKRRRHPGVGRMGCWSLYWAPADCLSASVWISSHQLRVLLDGGHGQSFNQVAHYSAFAGQDSGVGGLGLC